MLPLNKHRIGNERLLQLLNPKCEPFHESQETEVDHDTQKHQEILLWSDQNHLLSHWTKPHPENHYMFQFPLPQASHLYSCSQYVKQPL